MSISDEDIAREAVAQWMIAHSYATGHGDTLNDLLIELTTQAMSIGVNSTYVNPNLLNKNNNIE